MSELEQRFCEHFDEICDPVKFGYLEYSASDVLKAVDPVAFRQEYLNWLDAEGLDEDSVQGEV